MGPYRTAPTETRARRERAPVADDPSLEVFVALVSAPIVIAALVNGVTWGAGESIAGAALVLALANLVAPAASRERTQSRTAVRGAVGETLTGRFP